MKESVVITINLKTKKSNYKCPYIKEIAIVRAVTTTIMATCSFRVKNQSLTKNKI